MVFVGAVLLLGIILNKKESIKRVESGYRFEILQCFPPLQLHTPFNKLLMVLVLLESITVVYGIPVDFLASWNRGCFFQTDSFCTATGRGGEGRVNNI